MATHVVLKDHFSNTPSAIKTVWIKTNHVGTIINQSKTPVVKFCAGTTLINTFYNLTFYKKQKLHDKIEFKVRMQLEFCVKYRCDNK